MIFRQFLHDEPIAASYLFGCGGHSAGAVVDPVDDAELYLRAAEESGLEIRYVVDTHVHTDHVSGGRELAARADAEYVLHGTAGADYDFHAVEEGDVLDLGNVEARALHTPGHTPEHLSLVVTDQTRGPAPWFVVTGHTLMVGDLGRTELASNAEDGARALFESVKKLRELPDHVEICPGAYSGSVCGRGLSGKPMSTIGFERRFNRTFGMDDGEAFVRLMSENIPPRPPRADETRAINLGAAPATASAT